MRVHELYAETQAHALEVIGPAIDHNELESLRLEGDFHFNSLAKQIWMPALNHLLSLSISGISLISEMTSALQGQFPLLHTLHLSAFESLDIKATIHPGPASLSVFLSELTLTHVSLLGFHSSILMSIVKASNDSIRSLKFHIRESSIDLLMRAGPSIKSLLSSPSDLRTIADTCPKLESFTLDIPRSSLLAHNEKDSQSDSILLILAAMRCLQRIQLYLHTTHIETGLPPPTRTEITAAYAFFHAHKCGYPIEELVVCTEVRGAYERWDVWELGPRLAGIMFRNTRDRVQEIWDVENGWVKEREEWEGCEAGTLRPEWGVMEGWGC